MTLILHHHDEMLHLVEHAAHGGRSLDMVYLLLGIAIFALLFWMTDMLGRS